MRRRHYGTEHGQAGELPSQAQRTLCGAYARTEDHLGTVRLHGIIKASTGIDFPHDTAHKTLRDENLTS